MGKRELVALLNLSSVMVERLFLAVPRGCLQFVIVVFPDYTHFLFLRPGKVQTSLLLRYREWLEYLKFVYCKPIKVQNKRKFTFFSVNTKYISSSMLKASEISLVLGTRDCFDVFNTLDEIYLVRTRENFDVFNTLDEIYLVFASKE